MRKNFEEPTLEVIKFAMNETITSEEDAWIVGGTLSYGVEFWE